VAIYSLLNLGFKIILKKNKKILIN